MKTAMKVFLIIGIGLFALGIVITGVGFALAGGDFANILPAVEQTEANQDFDGKDVANLVVDDDYNDIEIVPSSDADIHVTYYEAMAGDYSLLVDGDTLTIQPAHKVWWRYIGIYNFAPKKMTIAIPDTLTTVNVSADAASLTLSDVTLAGDLNVDTDTGNVKISDVTTGDIAIQNDTGNVELDNVIAGDVSADENTGSIKFTDVNCSDIDIDADAGAIALNNVDAQAVKAASDTGEITFDQLAVAKSLELSTDFGSIRGTIDDALTAFTITSSVDMGDNSLPSTYRGGDKILKAEADTGSIDIEFLQ